MKTRIPDIFGISTVASLDQWKSLTAHHSNERRSAYLVGQRWLGSSGEFPPAIKRVIMASASMQSLRPAFSVAEHITVLDTFTAPSRTDLMVYCRNGTHEKAVIALEGKMTENFDEQSRCEATPKWPGTSATFRSPDQRRQATSVEMAFQSPGLILYDRSTLRYQLIHRTVDALLEAKHIGARSAICWSRRLLSAPRIREITAISRQRWASHRSRRIRFQEAGRFRLSPRSRFTWVGSTTY
jgi:hypothetical protein